MASPSGSVAIRTRDKGAPGRMVTAFEPEITGWLSTTNVAPLSGGRSARSTVRVVVWTAPAEREIRGAKSGPDSDPGEVSVLAETLAVAVPPAGTDTPPGALMIGPFCGACGDSEAPGARGASGADGAGEGEGERTLIWVVKLVVPPSSVAWNTMSYSPSSPA